MRYVPRAALLCAVCALLSPVGAHGQRGVQLDPDSPAGVEYQLPLEQARKKAGGSDPGDAGSRGDRGAGGGAAALFGAGIVPAGGDDRSGGGANGEAGTNRGSSGGTDEGGRDDSGKASTPGSDAIRPAALDGPDDGESSAGLRIAGIALAVLLAGALLGFALRRGLGQSEE